MKNNTSLLYNLFLVVGDLVALVISFAAAFVIRSAGGVDVAHPMSGRSYLLILLALLPFWILIFALLGLYNGSIYEKRFSEAGRLLIGSFTGLLFVVFWDYMSLTPIFPAKLVPIYGFVIAFLLLLMFRNLLRAFRVYLFGYGVGLIHIVIVGNTPVTTELIESLHDSRVSGYKILGLVGYRKHNDYGIVQYPNFQAFLDSEPQGVHSIIQTEMYANEERNTEVLSYAQEHHVSYRFVPGNSELFVGNIDVDLFRNSLPVIHIHHTALFGWGRVVKRLTDVLFGLILFTISLPLQVLCALLVKLSDPSGPILYKAKRYSRFGNQVYVYKFRSFRQAYNNMSPEDGFRKLGRPELIAEYRANGDQLDDDPRISRVGKFLRATSLDELPQLWNIVHGEISLVGPRALDIFEMEKYNKKNLILSVKSGLTGLAVVSGRHAMSFEERRKLDLYYVQNWSFWLDIVIILKTVRVVLERLFRRGKRYQ